MSVFAHFVSRSIFVLALFGLLPAKAATDLSDLWWNPNESGWGLNISHQGEILFATLFVYSPSRQAAWYVAPDMASSDGATYSGALYETKGPWFGGAFDPQSVTVRRVGTIAFAVATPGSAGLAYNVDGASVATTVARQTFRNRALAGSYYGASVGIYAGECPIEGYAEEPIEINAEQGDGTLTIEAVFNVETCRFSGPYVQEGRLGRSTGEVDCGNGPIGTFTATRIEGGGSTFGADLTVTYPTCRWTGRLGGVRLGAEP